MIDELLRAMDPAAQVPDDLADGAPGRAALARAMAQDANPRSTKGGTSRFLAVAATVVVAGGAVWTASGFFGTPAAEAGWSATPQPPTTAQEEEQAQRCLEFVDAGNFDGSSSHDAVPALVEVRGDFAFTVAPSADGRVISCLLPLRPLSTEVQGLALTAPDDAPAGEETVVSRGVIELDGDNGSSRAAITGRVGSEVQAVHVLVDGRQVEATVRGGRFAAWWPQGAGILPDFGSPDPDVTLTLRDGTTRTAKLSHFRPARF